ncbi:MAG: hypothetical protein WCX77_03175 [Candidatus Paceibacterota bacterium]|jgi:hypothetical protein
MAKKVVTRIRQKKRTTRKRKQTVFLKKATLYSFLAVGFLSAGLYLFYFSPYFQLEKVEVRNAKMVSSDDLKKAISEKYHFSVNFFGKEISSNSILLPVFSSASILKNFPQVEKLSFSRDFPNVLTLEVKEREPFAIWCKDWDQRQDCFWSDKTGFSFRPYNPVDQDSPGDPLVIEEKEGVETMLSGTKMEKKDFVAWSNNLKEELNSQPEIEKIIKFSVFSDKLSLKTQKGFEIYFDPQGDLGWQTQKLKAVLKEKISSQKIKVSEYIDLRFGNQAVVK